MITSTALLQDTTSDNPVEKEHRRSTAQMTKISFGLDFLTFLSENEPRIYEEAMGSPKAPFWEKGY